MNTVEQSRRTSIADKLAERQARLERKRQAKLDQVRSEKRPEKATAALQTIYSFLNRNTPEHFYIDDTTSVVAEYVKLKLADIQQLSPTQRDSEYLVLLGQLDAINATQLVEMYAYQDIVGSVLAAMLEAKKLVNVLK